jgi:hypothetical protein
MEFENNWVVPVLHDGPMAYSMIDPGLKIEMLVVRPHQEPDEVGRDLQIYYDPGFRSEALTRQWTQDEIASSFLRAPPENPLRPARSDQHRKIATLAFDARFYPEQGDDPEELLVRLYSKSLRTTASLLSKADVPIVSKHLYPFLYHCIKHCVEMAVWDELAVYQSMGTVRSAQIRRIRFLIKSTVAEELAPFRGRLFEEAGDGQCLFSLREVRL